MERLLSEACLARARRRDTSVITSGQAALPCSHTQRYAGEPAGPSAGPDRRKLLIIVSINTSSIAGEFSHGWWRQ